MTTSQKLWLGFGALTALLVLSSVAIIVRVRSIEGQVGEMENKCYLKSQLFGSRRVKSSHQRFRCGF